MIQNIHKLSRAWRRNSLIAQEIWVWDNIPY